MTLQQHRLASLVNQVRDRIAAGVGNGHRVRLTTLAWVLVVAAGVQLAMLKPPFPSDSLAYLNWAAELPRVSISHGTTRLGVLLPVRLAIEGFGYSEAAYYVIPSIHFLVLVGSIYVIGASVAGSVAGAVAALATATSTITLGHTSQIVPDPFAAAWFTCAVAIILRAERSANPNLLLLTGGLTFGIAYACREYALFLIPVIGVVGWAKKWNHKQWLLLGAGFLIVVVVEWSLLGVIFGDPLARLKAIAGFADKGATGASELLKEYGAGATRATVLSRAPRAFMAFSVGSLLLAGVAALAITFLVSPRHRGVTSVLLVWIASMWVPMILLAGILDPQTPRIRDNHIRYWFLVLPAMFLALAVVGRAVVDAIRLSWVRWTTVLSMIVILSSSVSHDLQAIPRSREFRGTGATQWDEVRDWLRRSGSAIDHIYTDERMARVLPLYTREVFGQLIWNGEVRIFEKDGVFIPVQELDGAYVLHELGVRYLRNRGLTIPAEYLEPGQQWEVAVRRGDDTLVVFVRRQAENITSRRRPP